LVDVLFNSGVCQKCDAMIERGTAAAKNGGAKPPAGGPGEYTEPCKGYKAGPERGICGKCGYSRAEHLAAKKARGDGRQKKTAPAAPRRKRVGAEPGSVQMTIEQLRSTYTESRERCLREADAWLAKLEVLEEVEAAIKKGH